MIFPEIFCHLEKFSGNQVPKFPHFFQPWCDTRAVTKDRSVRLQWTPINSHFPFTQLSFIVYQFQMSSIVIHKVWEAGRDFSKRRSSSFHTTQPLSLAAAMLCPAQAPLLQDLVVSSLVVPESCYHFLSRESRAEFGRERCLKREECCSSSVPNREEVVSPEAPGSCLAGQTVR